MPDSSPHLGGQPGAHAIERAWERYGVDLTPADLDAIAADCTEGRSVLLRHDEHADVHMVRYAGVVMVVAMRGGVIVTFLPPQGCTRKVQLRHLARNQALKMPGGRRFKSRRRDPRRREGGRRW